MFVRMDMSLKYSQKRNFFEQKNKIFKSRGVDASHAPPRSYAPENNKELKSRTEFSISLL